jgi:hypothetical protein
LKLLPLLAHFAIPTLFAVFGLVFGAQRATFEFELLAMFLTVLFFYAAPHLLWAGLSAALQPKKTLWHAGFMLSSLSLAVISVMGHFVRDPSGLPYQWFLYWPLAGLVLAAVVCVHFLGSRARVDA